MLVAFTPAFMKSRPRSGGSASTTVVGYHRIVAVATTPLGCAAIPNVAVRLAAPGASQSKVRPVRRASSAVPTAAPSPANKAPPPRKTAARSEPELGPPIVPTTATVMAPRRVPLIAPSLSESPRRSMRVTCSGVNVRCPVPMSRMTEESIRLTIFPAVSRPARSTTYQVDSPKPTTSRDAGVFGPFVGFGASHSTARPETAASNAVPTAEPKPA